MIRNIITATTIATLLFSSCIKDEELNKEGDIEEISLPSDIMDTYTIRNRLDAIDVYVYDTTGFHNKKIAPSIVTSPGATVFPASGDSVALENYTAKYTVTPEDGHGSRTYTLRILPPPPLEFNFESWYTVSNAAGTRVYDMLTESLWSNANAGVTLRYFDNTPFPTRKTTEAKSGKYAAFLETVEGQRSAISTLDIPLYAGNLFYGTFSANLGDPVTSAKFGQILSPKLGKPVKFTGWYKYQPGEVYQYYRIPEGKSKKDVILAPGVQDKFSVYAVLFEVKKDQEGQNQYLSAHDIINLDESKLPIVAKAFLEDYSPKAEYTYFDIPFTYLRTMDSENNAYKLAIVFSSSQDGAFYEGAIGSKLWVDEVEVVCEEIEE